MLFQSEKFFDNQQPRVFFSRLFRKIFLDDWLMKLIALIITLALWFGVTGMREPRTARYRGIPLTLRVANNIEVTNSPVAEVDIIVSGDKRRIDPINPRDLVVSLDLTDVQPGERTVQITPENVNVELPQGVKLEEIQPNKIAVKLEAVEEREITVRAETEGSIADGFEIYGEPIVLPQKVRVRGPASFIRSIDFLSTEKINLTDRNADFTARQVPLNVVNPKITLLDTVVDVVFRIGEQRVERLFIVPVQTETGERRVQVLLYGAASLLANLAPEQIQIELVKTEAGDISAKATPPPELADKIEVRRTKINP